VTAWSAAKVSVYNFVDLRGPSSEYIGVISTFKLGIEISALDVL